MNAFDKVIGHSEVKREMVRYCDVLKNPDYYKELGVKIPRGVLLDGNPGIGKTLLANCFIEESGCKAFTIRKDKPDGDFVKEIRHIFDEAKKEFSAIVFLDDMDKFANEDEDHKNAEEYVTIQACIDDCKETQVFVIATINDRSLLPDSLIRAGRFDKVIQMNTLNGEETLDLFNYYLKQKEALDEIDIELFARLMEGYSCAELETIINEAGVNAGFNRRRKITNEDLMTACLERLYEAPERSQTDEITNVRNIAVHEAAHAVIGEILNPGSVTLVTICYCQGDKQGVTVTKHINNHIQTKSEMDNDIIRRLAGKAATEIIFGEPDVGCSMDLFWAFENLRTMVDELCAFGFNSYLCRESSDYVRENIDRTLSREMDNYYQKARKILIENRVFFDLMVDELIEKKTLTYKDIAKILNKISNR